jgi:glutaminyl-tRNA synthetase
VVKDEQTGEIIELHCSYDPESHTGGATAGRKIKGTSHWVSAAHAAKAEVRLYDHLFMSENPDDEEEGLDYKDKLNPNSMEVLSSCLVEPSLLDAKPGSRYQFMRQGYFCIDPIDTCEEKLVFNRIVSLRDTWAKIQKG